MIDPFGVDETEDTDFDETEAELDILLRRPTSLGELIGERSSSSY
jgi:hypothetical protein